MAYIYWGGDRGFPVRIVTLAGIQRHTVGAQEDFEMAGQRLEDRVRVSQESKVVEKTVHPNGNARAIA